jgi:hypothetical protein
VTCVSFKNILSILLGFSFSPEKREEKGSSSMDT